MKGLTVHIEVETIVIAIIGIVKLRVNFTLDCASDLILVHGVKSRGHVDPEDCSKYYIRFENNNSCNNNNDKNNNLYFAR